MGCPLAPKKGLIFKHQDHEFLRTYSTFSFHYGVCVYCGGGPVMQSLTPHLPRNYDFVIKEANIPDDEKLGYKFEFDDKGRVTRIVAPNGDVAIITFDESGMATVSGGK